MSKNILITGTTGFVGTLLVPYLEEQGHHVIAPTRANLGGIGPETDWTPYLKDVDAVIHLAGRAHVMQEEAKDPLSLYREINSFGTETLAKQAASSGVKRFIFSSSVKVMGEASDHPLSAQIDAPNPSDPYGQSKLEGEQALGMASDKMEVVILRLPLVYGPGVKGNFINLLKLLQKGLPLPFGAINNKRSMIYTGNLISAIGASLTCTPGTYFPSDQDDLSTTDLVRSLKDSLGCSTYLLPIPSGLLKLAGLVTGKKAMIQRLTGSLTVDGKLDQWQPPFSAETGLQETAKWFKNEATRP